MDVRGNRACKDCGTHFSYYETGSPACPECGSLHTVGVGDRAVHTDRPAELDLSGAIEALAEGRYRHAGQEADETARRYVRRRGFINGGELRGLDDTYLAAHEIKEVAQLLRLSMGREDEPIDREYVDLLFESAQSGSWPTAESVPEAMAGPRGLAVVAAVGEYRDAMKTWSETKDTAAEMSTLLQRLEDHLRRVRALEGGIEPTAAETLVAAARALGEYIRTGTGQETVAERLDELRDHS